MRETWVQSLGWEGPLEMGTATHSSILTWRIPWKKEPGGLQPMGSKRVRPNWETFTPYIWLWCQALFKIHIYGFKNPLCYNSIYKSVYIYITIVIYNSIYIYIYIHIHTHTHTYLSTSGFPSTSGVKICLPSRRHGFDPWVRKIPWRRKWQPTPVFLPRQFRGQRSLAGYSPWGCKELHAN